MSLARLWYQSVSSSMDGAAARNLSSSGASSYRKLSSSNRFWSSTALGRTQGGEVESVLCVYWVFTEAAQLWHNGFNREFFFSFFKFLSRWKKSWLKWKPLLLETRERQLPVLSHRFVMRTDEDNVTSNQTCLYFLAGIKNMLPFNNYIYEVWYLCIYPCKQPTVWLKVVNGREICCFVVSLMDFLRKRVEIGGNMQKKNLFFFKKNAENEITKVWIRLMVTCPHPISVLTHKEVGHVVQ